MKWILILMLAMPSFSYAATYQCDDYVITDNPYEYSGCVNIETGEKPDESSAIDGSSKGKLPEGAELAQLEIESRNLVEDTAIKNEDGEVTLIVKMNSAVNESYAKQTGEDFLRLYMTFSNEETGSPGREIGETKFDYLIGIINSQGEFLYQTAKIGPETDLVW